MGDCDINVDRVLDLAGAICDQTASQDDCVELDSIVAADEEARRFYCGYCWMHITLGMEGRIDRALSHARERDNLALTALAPWESDAIKLVVPSTASAASLPPLPTALHNSFSYLSSGWPVAYLIATVIFGIGAIIGAFTHVSQPAQIAHETPPAANDREAVAPAVQQVGRITGMVDCRWKQGAGDAGWGTGGANRDQSLIPNPQSLVSLGDKFNLTSGLLEITYDTGAKVILQGPVTYEVESAGGGFLSLGKITARLEKGEGGRWKGEKSTNPKSEIRNQKSPFPLPPSPFVIKTPTAVVTDLGTEFGVEVSKEGQTTSHVFRGSVRVQAILTGGKTQGEAKVLRENESARVTPHDGQRQIVALHTFTPSTFVRQIPQRTINAFDLVDMVAGGDGFSGRRGRGINPATGQPADNAQAEQRDRQPYHRLGGDYKYHRVQWHPFVDGVFIPDGSQGPIQINSAGHTFEDFGGTRNSVTMNIWAGGPVVAGKEPQRLRTELGGVEYAAPGHGLIFLAANSAITFDLDAIRKANPNRKLLRFRAVAGNTEIRSLEKELKHAVGADIWVFVDGKLAFRRREVTYYMGAQPVNIALRDGNRFLTLVSTDGGSGTWYDWTMFGDPRLEFVHQTIPDAAAGARQNAKEP